MADHVSTVPAVRVVVLGRHVNRGGQVRRRRRCRRAGILAVPVVRHLLRRVPRRHVGVRVGGHAMGNRRCRVIARTILARRRVGGSPHSPTGRRLVRLVRWCAVGVGVRRLAGREPTALPRLGVAWRGDTTVLVGSRPGAWMAVHHFGDGHVRELPTRLSWGLGLGWQVWWQLGRQGRRHRRRAVQRPTADV